jgi:hypothetical protein
VTSELLSVFNGVVELVSELEEPDRPGQPASARDGNRRPELPDPDERSRLYDLTCAHVDAEEPSYAAEVPRFQQMWADHLHRWPADHQPRTPLQLSPDRDAEATAAIARVREAEPAITADVLKVEQQNTCAARLEGIDHRLKGEPRLKEKVAAQLDAEPGQTHGIGELVVCAWAWPGGCECLIRLCAVFVISGQIRLLRDSRRWPSAREDRGISRHDSHGTEGHPCQCRMPP